MGLLARLGVPLKTAHYLMGGRGSLAAPGSRVNVHSSEYQGVLTLKSVGAIRSLPPVYRRDRGVAVGAVGRLAGLRKLEDPVFLDRLNTAQRVSMSGPGQVFNSAVSVVQSALTVTGFLAALLVLSPVMAVVLLVATTPGIFAEVGIARRRAAMLEGISHAARRQYFYANLLSSLAAAKEIRLFGLGLFFRRRMLNELRVIQQSGQRVDRRQAVVYVLLAALSAIVAGAGIWWAVSSASHSRLTVGDVSMFVAALGAASAALTGIVSNAAMAYQAVLTFRSYINVVSEGPDLARPADPVPARPLRRGIEFEDVWFRYGPDRPWVLRGVRGANCRPSRQCSAQPRQSSPLASLPPAR